MANGGGASGAGGCKQYFFQVVAVHPLWPVVLPRRWLLESAPRTPLTTSLNTFLACLFFLEAKNRRRRGGGFCCLDLQLPLMNAFCGRSGQCFAPITVEGPAVEPQLRHSSWRISDVSLTLLKQVAVVCCSKARLGRHLTASPIPAAAIISGPRGPRLWRRR